MLVDSAFLLCAKLHELNLNYTMAMAVLTKFKSNYTLPKLCMSELHTFLVTPREEPKVTREEKVMQKVKDFESPIKKLVRNRNPKYSCKHRILVFEDD